MASRVDVPMTDAGAFSSTRGRRAAACASAFAPSASPGAMMPPTNVPSASSTSKFVVVPRSTTTSLSLIHIFDFAFPKMVV